MTFTAGQKIRLERNPIYASSVTNVRLQETTREIAEVQHLPNNRIGIKFKGSKIWYSTYEGSEWIQSQNVKSHNIS